MYLKPDVVLLSRTHDSMVYYNAQCPAVGVMDNIVLTSLRWDYENYTVKCFLVQFYLSLIL